MTKCGAIHTFGLRIKKEGFVCNGTMDTDMPKDMNLIQYVLLAKYALQHEE